MRKILRFLSLFVICIVLAMPNVASAGMLIPDDDVFRDDDYDALDIATDANLITTTPKIDITDILKLRLSKNLAICNIDGFSRIYDISITVVRVFTWHGVACYARDGKLKTLTLDTNQIGDSNTVSGTIGGLAIRDFLLGNDHALDSYSLPSKILLKLHRYRGHY